MKVAVIGAGIGGLAIAIRMAARGHQVTLFEQAAYPGGKVAEIKKEGFRFDTGPSLFTLPELAGELFALAGEKMEEHLPVTRLENNCRYFFPDGTVFTFYQEKSELEQELRTRQIKNPEAVFRRLEKARKMYEVGAPVFMFSNFHKLSNFNTAPYKKVASQLHVLDLFRTMHKANENDFDDPRMVQLFDRYATYNGSNPYRTPATLNMIAHLENNLGAWFPLKGMYSIADSLYRLALRQGVRFRFNTPIRQIVVENKKAVALETSRGRENYDIVVSDADVHYVASELLKKHPLRKRLTRMEPSSSALIFYWGINRTFPRLEIHNILFSADYREEFRQLAGKTICNDPTVYIFISSKIVKEDAPEGCENWFVMINVPANSGQDWDELTRKARKDIIRKINRQFDTDIEQYIITEEVASPVTIEKKTNSSRGALYGTASNSMFAAFLRHPNRLNGIKNLFFTGGSVHPGGGIPLCLASARIVEQEIVAGQAGGSGQAGSLG